MAFLDSTEECSKAEFSKTSLNKEVQNKEIFLCDKQWEKQQVTKHFACLLECYIAQDTFFWDGFIAACICTN